MRTRALARSHAAHSLALLLAGGLAACGDKSRGGAEIAAAQARPASEATTAGRGSAGSTSAAAGASASAAMAAASAPR